MSVRPNELPGQRQSRPIAVGFRAGARNLSRIFAYAKPYRGQLTLTMLALIATREVVEARQLMSSGDYTGAVRVLEDIVEKAPEMATAWEWLARSHVASGDARAATVVIEQWQATGNTSAPDRSSVLRLQDAVDFEGMRGYWSWTLEDLTAAEAEGARAVPRMDFASAHAALGHTDEAFRFLYEALMLSEREILTLRTDPVWDEYRSIPAFQRIMRETRSLRFSPARRPSRGGG